MRTTKSFTLMLAFSLALVLLNAIPAAWSQEVTAAVVGTVSDPSGAPIKGATVTARDVERGTAWTAETNGTGDFTILRLPIGTYTAEATAPGFEKAAYPRFTLVLNQTARLEFKMKVGQVSETIEVTGAAQSCKHKMPRWAPSSIMWCRKMCRCSPETTESSRC